MGGLRRCPARQLRLGHRVWIPRPEVDSCLALPSSLTVSSSSYSSVTPKLDRRSRRNTVTQTGGRVSPVADSWRLRSRAYRLFLSVAPESRGSPTPIASDLAVIGVFGSRRWAEACIRVRSPSLRYPRLPSAKLARTSAHPKRPTGRDTPGWPGSLSARCFVWGGRRRSRSRLAFALVGAEAASNCSSLGNRDRPYLAKRESSAPTPSQCPLQGSAPRPAAGPSSRPVCGS